MGNYHWTLRHAMRRLWLRRSPLFTSCLHSSERWYLIAFSWNRELSSLKARRLLRFGRKQTFQRLRNKKDIAGFGGKSVALCKFLYGRINLACMKMNISFLYNIVYIRRTHQLWEPHICCGWTGRRACKINHRASTQAHEERSERRDKTGAEMDGFNYRDTRK